MKILTQSLILACLFYGTAASAADAQDFDVTQSMSVAQFRAAGLDKLSDAQLKSLDIWFAQYLQQQGPACPPAASGQTGVTPNAAPAMAATPAATPTVPADSINAHIAGDFDGWRGSTRFTLDNGQVWEQMDDSVVTFKRVANPKVTITRGLFNSYYITVEGMNESVQVKRIRP
ncbi:MAG TPA: hypothetical protein VGN70_07445 [Gammaproteobacteria bacterium]|jgi:hypothetical protein